MFVNIQAFFLNALVNTETVNSLDGLEENNSCNGCPCVYADDSKKLGTQESEPVTVKSTAAYGENRGKQSTENSAHAVH